MAEKKHDQASVHPMEEVSRSEDSNIDNPPSQKTGSSSMIEISSQDNPISTEHERLTEVETTPPGKQLVVEGKVLGSLAIRELEMTRVMDDIERLEEISVGGETNIEPEVIGAIAGVAAEAVEGVASLGATSLRRTIRERIGGAERRARGVAVEVGRREVIIDINLRVIYGYNIPTMVVNVRQSVADLLLRLCGLVAKEINVKVTGLEYPERISSRVE